MREMVETLATALEFERDRWILWSPVALASGIGCYFALPVEPWPGLGLILLVFALAAVLIARRRPGWPLLMGLMLASAGFAAAQGRSAAVAAPSLTQATGLIRLQGRVLAIEPLVRGQRLVLDRLSGGTLAKLGIERVRVRLRGRDEIRPGQRVQMMAFLMPPPSPVVPGGTDFARQAFFQRWGGVGYAVGRAVPVARTGVPTIAERVDLWLVRQRQALSQRIVGAIVSAGYGPGTGAVAAALLTGERGAVPPAMLQSYRDAGLAHVLVIAGMHLSMVAGLILVLLRGLLALCPWLALRYPIHKWTAAGAWLVTFCYLLLSGAPVPTQRAFLMISAMLLAILLDRSPASLRAITLAALVILLIQPESLLSPSFQLSFSAVYGLIAGYEALGPRLQRLRQSAQAPWEIGLLYAGGILLTTQIAGSATAFYSLYHFNRYAVYALLGNCLAVPLVGFWVMPAALLAMILLPFGFDDVGWRLMAAGLQIIGRAAFWVAHLPGAALTWPALPPGTLVGFSLGFAWLVLWRRRWRWGGLAAMGAALAVGLLSRPPDLLVSDQGRVVALREADGRLHATPGRGDRSLRASWAQWAGEGDRMPILSPANRVGCDTTSCKIQRDGIETDLRLPPDVRFGTRVVWLTDPPRFLSVAAWQGDRPWRR